MTKGETAGAKAPEPDCFRYNISIANAENALIHRRETNENLYG